MSLRRYPTYKDSGVEWLGEVPGHWAVAALGYRYRVELGKMLDAKQITGKRLAPYLRNSDVQWGQIRTTDLPEMDFNDDDSKRFSLFVGDLLVCEGGEVGRCAIWKGELQECYYQKALHRLRPILASQDSTKFLFWILHAAVASGCFAADEQKATIAHLPAEAFRRYRFPFPLLPEQAYIAAFLDRETAKLDALVAEQQRLIELLKEKRQAVISHAVTKGLNPDAPMKDSGVDWLGEVPAHWRCVRNKTVFQVVDERTDSENGELLTVSHITGVTRRSEKNVNMILAETLQGYKMCRRGDLVINTMWAWMGALGCSPLDGLVSPAYNVYRPRSETVLLPAFYDYLCRLPSHATAMKARSSGVWESRLRLYPNEFLDMRLIIPPLHEQLEIVERLASLTAAYDTLTTEAQRAIDLLQERRAALISAAVTGQINVQPTKERTLT